MNAKERVREIVDESNLSLSTIAEKAGYKRASNISEAMRVDNMRVDSFVRILNACGYKLIIRAEQKGIPDREVELE